MIFATGERNLRERHKLGIVTVDQRKHPGLTGWWLSHLPLWKMMSSSGGMMTYPQYMESQKIHVPNHQPAYLINHY
jgi:hypothetical protein